MTAQLDQIKKKLCSYLGRQDKGRNVGSITKKHNYCHDSTVWLKLKDVSPP